MEPLRVSGDVKYLSAIREYVIAAAKEAGLDKKSSYKLRLAVDEVATNIIKHGYEEAGLQGDVCVRANIDEGSLTIALEDTGIAYDPTQKERADEEKLRKPLIEREPGGWGEDLAYEGVDRWIYERVDDRNRNIFVVNLADR